MLIRPAAPWSIIPTIFLLSASGPHGNLPHAKCKVAAKCSPCHICKHIVYIYNYKITTFWPWSYSYIPSSAHVAPHQDSVLLIFWVLINEWKASKGPTRWHPELGCHMNVSVGTTFNCCIRYFRYHSSTTKNDNNYDSTAMPIMTTI